MNKIVTLLFALLLTACLYGQEKRNIAVFETQGTAKAAVREEVKLALVDGLRNSPNVRVFERSELSKVMSEHSLQMSDSFTESKAIEVGRLAGAGYICVSSVNSANDFEYRIVYRLVDVTTGETLVSERLQATKNNLYATIDKIAESKLFIKEDDGAGSFVCGCEVQKQDFLEGAKIPAGWRLPTLEELKCMCANKDKIGGFNFGAYKSRTKQQGHVKGVKFQFCDEVFAPSNASVRLVRRTKEEVAAGIRAEEYDEDLSGSSVTPYMRRKAAQDSTLKAREAARKLAAEKQEQAIAQAKLERELAELREQAVKDSIAKVKQNMPLTLEGSKIYVGSEKLRKKEVRSYMANTEALKIYDMGKSQRRKGGWLIGTGIFAVAAGVGFDMIWYADNATQQYVQHGNIIYQKTYFELRGGIVGGVVGATLITTGAILRSKGRKKLQQSVDLYNTGKKKTAQAEFKIGFTGSGIGLALNF